MVFSQNYRQRQWPGSGPTPVARVRWLWTLDCLCELCRGIDGNQRGSEINKVSGHKAVRTGLKSGFMQDCVLKIGKITCDRRKQSGSVHDSDLENTGQVRHALQTLFRASRAPCDVVNRPHGDGTEQPATKRPLDRGQNRGRVGNEWLPRQQDIKHDVGVNLPMASKVPELPRRIIGNSLAEPTSWRWAPRSSPAR